MEPGDINRGNAGEITATMHGILKPQVKLLEAELGGWVKERRTGNLQSFVERMYGDLDGILIANYPSLTPRRIREAQIIKQSQKGKFVKRYVLLEDNDGKAHPDLPKLVRDKIPKMLGNKGISYVVRDATPDEMPDLLVKKLREELGELFNARSDQNKFLDEMVDVYEVLDRIIGLNQRVSRSFRKKPELQLP